MDIYIWYSYLCVQSSNLHESREGQILSDSIVSYNAIIGLISVFDVIHCRSHLD